MVAQGSQDRSLFRVRLLEHTDWLSLTAMPAKATGEIAHGLHSTVGRAVNSGPIQPEAEQTEVSQGNNAGKKVAADLGIRPVPHGTDVPELQPLSAERRFQLDTDQGWP